MASKISKIQQVTASLERAASSKRALDRAYRFIGRSDFRSAARWTRRAKRLIER